MSADIVARLRAGTGGGKHWMELHTEAADTIESQAAEIAELRSALLVIRNNSSVTMHQIAVIDDAMKG